MTWYRSLYWRIAVGFTACLALLLLVQGMLFVWMMAQAGSAIPNQPPDRLAQTIASDVADALDRDASLDIDHYVRQEFAKDSQPFFVALVEGRDLEIGARFPNAVKTEARQRVEAMHALDPERLVRRPPFGRGGNPGFPFPGAGRGGNDGGSPYRQVPGAAAGGGFTQGRGGPPGFRIGRPWPIVAGGRFVGLVVVPPEPPFGFLLTHYAPTLVTVAGATLILGAVLAAFVIFGPTRKRLKGVEDAARRLGGGDLSARAPAGGNDEVAAVGAAFNVMAEELAARTDALVAADRARRQLLADVSHELNTPVTAMRGYLETLSMPELRLDDATRARYLGIVGEETSRLERLIGELLDLARLEGGGSALQVERLRTADLFARVLDRHERAAAAAQVFLSTTIDAGADTLAGDRVRLEQALENLAANALRHAPEGSTVELRARNEGSTVALLVTDHGGGIPVEHLPRIFDRFYKADQSRAALAGAAGGSGLGLSIVKAIAERHRATVSVSSVPGHTVFTIAGLRREAGDSAPAVPAGTRPAR